MMSAKDLNTLFAAVHAAEFPAQSILRLRPDLQPHAVVILDGSPPQERVCSLNIHARKRGIVHGMTRLEVEELNGIQILSRSLETERGTWRDFSAVVTALLRPAPLAANPS